MVRVSRNSVENQISYPGLVVTNRNSALSYFAFFRCILASGISLEESAVIRSILEDGGQEQEGTPLVVSTPEIADKRVGDVLTDAQMISLLQVCKTLQ